MRRNRRPFAVPPERVVAVPRMDARCTKGRPCMRCAFLGFDYRPEGRSAPDTVLLSVPREHGSA